MLASSATSACSASGRSADRTIWCTPTSSRWKAGPLPLGDELLRGHGRRSPGRRSGMEVPIVAGRGELVHCPRVRGPVAWIGRILIRRRGWPGCATEALGRPRLIGPRDAQPWQKPHECGHHEPTAKVPTGKQVRRRTLPFRVKNRGSLQSLGVRRELPWGRQAVPCGSAGGSLGVPRDLPIVYVPGKTHAGTGSIGISH
jgi:hypothetical protein